MHDTTTNGPFPDDDLRRAMQRLIRFSGLLEPHDHGGIQVSVSEVMALGELVAVDSMSQQDLAALLGLEKSTVSRLAAGLERRGWLVRERDPGNRRFYRLHLTGDGRGAAERVGADLRARHRHLLGALTPVEREGLLAGLAGLVRVVEEAQKSSHTPR